MLLKEREDSMEFGLENMCSWDRLINTGADVSESVVVIGLVLEIDESLGSCD